MEHTISYVYSIKQSDDSRFTDNHNFVHYKINFLSFDLFLQISYCEKLNNIIVCHINNLIIHLIKIGWGIQSDRLWFVWGGVGGREGGSSPIVHVNCKLLGSALISLIIFPNVWITTAQKVV